MAGCDASASAPSVAGPAGASAALGLVSFPRHSCHFVQKVSPATLAPWSPPRIPELNHARLELSGGSSGERKRKGPAAAAAPKKKVRKPPKVCTVTVSQPFRTIQKYFYSSSEKTPRSLFFFEKIHPGPCALQVPTGPDPAFLQHRRMQAHSHHELIVI